MQKSRKLYKLNVWGALSRESKQRQQPIQDILSSSCIGIECKKNTYHCCNNALTGKE